jgi:hypothetical protein
MNMSEWVMKKKEQHFITITGSGSRTMGSLLC